MTKIPFENSEILQQAKVTIDGVDYPITPAQMKVVQHYLSAEELNNLQDNIENDKEDKLTSINYTITDMPAHTSGTNSYILKKISKIIILNIRDLFINSISSNIWVEIGYIPSDIKPSVAVGTAAIITDASTGNIKGIGRVIVENTGRITVKSDVAISTLTNISNIMLVWEV